MSKKKYHGKASGIELKKEFGQHFLRDQFFVDHMLEQIEFTENSSVFEIGCGDGFLTRSILKKPLARLWIFEIDSNWANYVKKTYPDERMTIFENNILDVDFSVFDEHKPWILLSNLPYQITYPLIFKLIDYRYILQEAVLMIQEEVAQKIVKTFGRGYGFNSLYLQHFFEWKLLKKVPPTSFYPPPNVYSRLIHFKPRIELDKIPLENEFWKFIKRCFSYPRRNLKNNLKSFHYDLDKVPDEILNLRAQQMNKDDLLNVWNLLI